MTVHALPLDHLRLAAAPESRSAKARGESEGDAALEARFDRAAPGVFRFVLVRVGNDRHLADDIMQQVWLASRRNGGRIAPGEFEAWLRGAARNLIATHWRRLGARPDSALRADPSAAARLSDLLHTPDAPPAALASDETRGRLLLALTSLDTEDQALMTDHYVRGRSHAEIAQALGISPRAVEGRLYRARQALRQRLLETEDDHPNAT